METTTIVIPLLRQVDEWLERCVDSALCQTVPCNVVVVTSPSTPDSNRVVLDRHLTRDPLLRVIEQEPHMRFAGALNLGIRSTAADRIGFLLSDDWLSPTAVESAQAENADIVSTQMKIFGADGRMLLEPITHYRKQSEYDGLKGNRERAAYLGHFFLIRKSLIDLVGGVDETIGDSPGVDDFDMIWCLLDQGATVAIVEQALYNYRDHPGERLTTRRIEDMLATFNRILDKHDVHGPLRDELIRHHSRWFGKPIWAVYLEMKPKFVSAMDPSRANDPALRPKILPSALQPLQSLYRAVLPLSARITIQERFLWWWD